MYVVKPLVFKHIILTARPEPVEGYEQQSLVATSATNEYSCRQKKVTMAKVVIIGAGLTGLSAAYHLEQNGFFDFEIFEKENEVGGLCRSKFQDGFTFDYTGHLLHVNDDYFGKLLDDIVGLKNFEQIQRRSYIHSKDTYTPYPFQINLKGLPEDVIVECIEKFVSRPNIKNPKSFYQWVQTHFGEGLGKHVFFPFQNKMSQNVSLIYPEMGPINKITNWYL